MELILIVIYAIPLLFVFTYSLVQLNLVYLYVKSKKTKQEVVAFSDAFVPKVTVQLPLYNEKYVVERLLDCIAQIDYPKDKLEIQVLDDSTDESFEIAAQKVNEIRAKGIEIVHIKRADRAGYKAGALAFGLTQSSGEFVAIFDADFMPEPDFLKKTIPYFQREEVGMVQTKWGHLNADYSLLTKLQAFGLDAHFTVEQSGRSAGHHFINFNGTAGVWRKSCIEDAGGWSSDTLTEDLDLSYRAQLRHWEFVYLEEVTSPAELPMAMSALKNQQFRWTKGAAECVKKNLANVCRNKSLSLSTKLHAMFHLMNSSIFLCIVLMSVLSVPLLTIKYHHPEFGLLFKLASAFVISLFILVVFYGVSYRRENKGSWFSFLGLFPAFLSISMGLSLHNAIAVLEGYMGRKTPFVRTPKFNMASNTDQHEWKRNMYLVSSISWLSFLEFLFFVYFAFGIGLGFYYHDYGLLPFHIMLVMGYGFVFWKSTFHSVIALRSK